MKKKPAIEVVKFIEGQIITIFKEFTQIFPNWEVEDLVELLCYCLKVATDRKMYIKVKEGIIK